MATETTNYKMTKDAPNEHYNIDRVNANLDKIDTAIKAVDSDKVSKVAGKGLSTNDYTTLEKDKLAGIEANAKNYSHPSKHPASIITQDANNRFTTDAEKTKWNNTTTDLSALDNTVSGHLADDNAIKHKAKTIALEDTANKFTATNVESGMLELFTNVSNGKNLVGGAITGVDDSVVIPTDPTFGDLAGAIGEISTGKKWVKGSAIGNNSLVTFYKYDGSTYNANRVVVDGLQFKPSIIILYDATYTVGRTAIDATQPLKDGNVIGFDSQGRNFKLDGTSAYINDNGFALPIAGDKTRVSWTAIE